MTVRPRRCYAISQIDGTAANPITIRGVGGTANRDNVVLRGTGDTSRVFQIMHDYYILEVKFVANRIDMHALEYCLRIM